VGRLRKLSRWVPLVTTEVTCVLRCSPSPSSIGLIWPPCTVLNLRSLRSIPGAS